MDFKTVFEAYTHTQKTKRGPNILIKLWLLLASIYIKACQFDECDNAIKEAESIGPCNPDIIYLVSYLKLIFLEFL